VNAANANLVKNHIAAEKMQVVLRFVVFTFPTSIVAILVFIYLGCIAEAPNFPLVIVWGLFAGVNLAIRYISFVRGKALCEADLLLLSRRSWRHVLISGFIWAAAVLLVAPTLTLPRLYLFSTMLFALNMTSLPLMSDLRGVSSLFLPAWISMGLVLYVRLGWIGILSVAFPLACVYIVAHIIRNTLDELLKIRLARDEALQELSRVNAQQMMFFLSANHDIRQPLQAMGMYTSVLKSRSTTPEIDVIVEKLSQTFRSLEYLIDETIGFIKISMGLQKPEIMAIRFSKVAEHVQTHFGPLAAAKGIRLRIHFSAELMLMGCPHVIERIVDNLVANAIKYTERGGVLLTCRRRGASCSIEVWDSGRGIPEYEREQIFREFYRSESGDVSRSGGYGLGLTIVKRLCERIDSEITLTSRVGRGSVFKFRLPLGHAEPAPPVPAKASAGATDKQLSGMILIVDDDDDARYSLQLFLESFGASTVLAGDKAAALGLINQAAQIDLILTDQHLPDGMGSELIPSFMQRHANAKAVILTGEASPVALEKLKLDGHHVLQKPVEVAHLLEIVAALLGKE
jgi:signal transduction histidine kinase